MPVFRKRTCANAKKAHVPEKHALAKARVDAGFPNKDMRQRKKAHVPEKHALAKARVDAGFPKKDMRQRKKSACRGKACPREGEDMRQLKGGAMT